jgi:hypothetical protein
MGEKLVTIGVAIVGVATLAVLVSKNANTSGVIKSTGDAFAKALGAATAPVTGGGGMGMNGFTPIF